MQFTIGTGIRVLAYLFLAVGVSLLLWHNNLWNQPGLWLLLCAVVFFLVSRMLDKRSYRAQKLMLSSIIDNIPTAIYLKDSQGVYLLSNRQFEQMLGKTREEITGARDEDLFNRERAIRCRQDDIKVMDTEQMLEYEESLLTMDGNCTYINKKFPIRKPDGTVTAVCGLLIDITGYKTATENFARSSRAYQVLSRINSGMKYAASERDWLQDVCRHLVELGGYRMAWIGIAQRGVGQLILPVANAGDEFNYLAALRFSWHDQAEAASEPCGLAVRQNNHVIVNDISLQPAAVWRDEALQRGYMSMCCLPILQHNVVLGDEAKCMVLCICSTRKQVFDEAETVLIHELAEDIGFGIRAMREREDNLRAQLALNEEKQKIEMIVQGINAGVLLISTQRQIVWVNDQFRRWFCAQEECIDVDCKKCVSVAMDEVDRVALNVLQTGSVQRRSTWLTTEDGEKHFYDIVAAPLFNERKEMIRVVELVVDVTDKKLLEDARQKATRQLHEAQRIAHIGSWELDIKTGFLEWSDEVLRIFGVSREKFECSYQGLLSIVHPDDRPNVERAYSESLQKRMPYEIVHRVRLRDGRIKYVHQRCETEYGDANEPIRTFGTVQDITDQVAVEQALLVSEEHYRRLIESSTAIPWEMDIDTMRYLFIGARAEKLLGFSNDDWCASHFWVSHLHADDREKIQTIYRDAIQGGDNFEVEYRLVGLNGKTVWVRDNANILREPGMPVRLQGFMFDITEQRNAEEIARRTQKMDAVGQLTGGIAHDFNNQLSVIQGYLEFLAEYTRDKEKPLHWVTAASSAARRCIDLSRKLLDFSRKKAVAVEVVNINIVMEKMRDLIARSVTSRIHLDYRLEKYPSLIAVNSGELEDAILNLVLNARDAMPDSGQLTLSTENISISQDAVQFYPGLEAGQYVLLSIADTGQGISVENREHIFEPFFTTKGEGVGTGLGLAMVYSFVKRSGGVINVYSELGEGSIFQIYFPRQKASGDELAEADVVSDEAQIWRGHGEVVLLVDDEEGLRDVASNYLTRTGYKVVEAKNAEVALQIMQSGVEIDVLFSDVIMPGMNGYQLAHQVSQLKPDLPILLTSGFTGNADSQSDIELPLLNKPYSQVELAKFIHDLLGRSRARAIDKKDSSEILPTTSPGQRKRLVILDDEVSIGKLVCDVADSIDMDAVHYVHASDYMEHQAEHADVLVLDLMMPDMDGIQMIRLLASHESRIPLILISGVGKSVLHSAQELAYEHKLNIIGTLQKPFFPRDLKKMLNGLDEHHSLMVKQQKAQTDDYLVTEQDLREAVNQKQFVAWYQPQIELNTMKVIGFEALIRWRHPQRGLIPPNRFIPLAEKTGLIDDVTWQLFDQIAAGWKQNNLDQTVSINMTAGMFKNLDLPDKLHDIGSHYQFENNSKIVLEVTESALMGELTKSLDSLTRLRMKGYHLSIDDFGTGFSSMLQLYRAPFTELKIDQSFVMRMEKDMEALTIVESTINLAHNLNMKVVAEGVETESILKRLQSLGCDIAQGYFIARPMPMDDLMSWLENWKKSSKN